MRPALLTRHLRPATLLALGSATLLLAACGGGSQDSTVQAAGNAVTAAETSADRAAAEAARTQSVNPTFHMAPLVPVQPDDIDADGTESSALRAPQQQVLSPEAARVSTLRLTPDELTDALGRSRALGASALATTPKVNTVYTPAQIRAAYGLPALTAAAAAELGAGQTIYIVDAYDDPKIEAELAAFNTKFGLPVCTKVAIAANATLPLAAAPTTGCTFSKVYATAAGKMTATAPAYNAGWAGEIALDVQWAHAIAPKARIVLIEAASANNNDLLGAVQLANAMGPGVVSMSFGGAESSYTSTWDSAFGGSGMSYVASTGDSGYEVNWPAVSSKVLAVGGTSLSYDGSAARSEAAWSGAGGGLSAYVTMPSYQSGVTIPGQTATKMRGVADVSFNADPNTGQYTAIMSSTATSATFYSYGGTSVSAPQWAGLLAVANAKRAAAGKGTLGQVNTALYTGIAANASTYASAFYDVNTGNNGGCAACSARTGFDAPTGLGTPQAAALLAQLSGAAVPTPPLPAANLPTGRAATAWTATWAATDSLGNPLTYTITGAPAGLTATSSGVLSWATPVAGTYSFKVTATSSSGQQVNGTVSLVINKVTAAPVFVSVNANASTGVAFTLQLKGTSAAGLALSYALGANAPSGMTMSATGLISWPKPVAGTYTALVRVSDTNGGVTEGTVTITVTTPNRAPVMPTASVTVPIGVSWTLRVVGADPDGDAITYSATGMPSGMTISTAGEVKWAKTVKGSYKLTITGKDARGLSGSGVISVTVK